LLELLVLHFICYNLPFATCYSAATRSSFRAPNLSFSKFNFSNLANKSWWTLESMLCFLQGAPSPLCVCVCVCASAFRKQLTSHIYRLPGHKKRFQLKPKLAKKIYKMFPPLFFLFCFYFLCAYFGYI